MTGSSVVDQQDASGNCATVAQRQGRRKEQRNSEYTV